MRPVATALFALALWGLAGPAAAQVVDVFTVSNVLVDERAESATVARAAALEAGQRLAYLRLVERLVPQGARGQAPEPSRDLLREIVSGFSVEDEKTSAVRYLARMTVTFNPDAVRRRFRDAEVPWAETASKTLVVLPVYRTQGTIQLWDHSNLWHRAWRDLPDSDALVRLVVPPGETADLSDISPEQALAGDLGRIGAIARRYGAEGALIPVATVRPADAEGGRELEVTVRRFGANAEEGRFVRSYAGNAGAPPEALLAVAAAQLRGDIEEGWKQDNTLRIGERQELIAVVPLSGLPELIRLRRALGSVPEISRAELLSVTLEQAIFRLHYLGDPSQLALALSQRDLVLTQGAVHWQLTSNSLR